jgi:ribonuclease P protein subunit RPR2
MPDDARRIARERIRILFDLAQKEELKNPERAQRYISLARRLASRNRVHLPSNLKHLICPGCKFYMSPITSRTRIRQTREPHITITCLHCGYITRIPLRSRIP